MVISAFQTIEKEKIENLKFPSTDVLTDAALILERQASLERALSLGNLEHSKIKIFFEDESHCYLVETTVWGVTDERIILKQGVVIPIKRIHSVKL